MPKFQFNKLVRDGMLAMYERIGQKAKYRKLSKAEHTKALTEKIIEETLELSTHEAEGQEVIDEIADIQQALDDLKSLHSISDDQVAKAQTIKKDKKGGFAKGFFVETLELEDGDEWVSYYRREPKKYPELKDD